MKDQEIAEFLLGFIKSGDTVLEVGCGDCNLLREIKGKINVKAFGIDPIIQNVSSEIICMNLAAENIDKLNHHFNLIYTVYSLHHFSNARKFLERGWKKLLPGGKLIIIDWRYNANTGVNERYFKEEEIEQLLTSTNFQVDDKILQGDTQIFVSSKINW